MFKRFVFLFGFIFLVLPPFLFVPLTNPSSTAVLPGLSGGLLLPVRRPSPVALSSLCAPMPSPPCRLASLAPMSLSLARFTKSLVPSSTVRVLDSLLPAERKIFYLALNPTPQASQSTSMLSANLILTLSSPFCSQVRGREAPCHSERHSDRQQRPEARAGGCCMSCNEITGTGLEANADRTATSG